MSRGRRARLAAALVLVCLLPRSATATGAPPDSMPVPAQRSAIATAARPDSMPMPPAAPLSYRYDALEQGLLRPLTRSLDLALLVRRLGGGRREAANVDAQDRVLLPSTWWQPRVGYKPVRVEDMLSGAGPGTGPAPGHWTVAGAKTEGVSKGFTIKDRSGAKFAIKFDPLHFPELGSGADVVASKLYWAAGYNVPDNTIAFFHREDLEIAPSATRTQGGRKIAMSPGDIDELLRDVPREPDGTYRVVASRYLAGKPLGEWRYDGRRKGDREDRIPHELRRELRGLWAINAWINHTDCSARNTLDMYVTDGGRSFVRHHLIDFSGCLGSASIAAQPMRSGHEYWADFGTIASSLGTLALPPFDWERSVDPQLPGVGFVDAETFDPGDWRPYLANPAFDERTERDIRWGVRIVAAFTNEQIRAAVEQGHYRDARATDYLTRILEERRDKLVRRWLPGEVVVPARASNGVLDPIADAPDSSLTGSSSGAVPPPAAPSGSTSTPGLGSRAKRAVGNFLSDGWVVASSPFRARGKAFAWTGVVLGVEAILYSNDQELFDAAIRNREDPGFRGVIDVGNSIEPVGFMGRTNPIYVGALAAGYAFRIPVLRTIPAEILESHLIAGGVRNIGKAVVGRRHPYEGVGPSEFKFGEGTSFPSGHASVAFELATIASMNAHSLPVTIAAYSLATTLALQRVESGNHWSSDVFISAVYGTLISRTVVNLHRQREERRRNDTSVVPHFSGDGRLAGVRVVRHF